MRCVGSSRKFMWPFCLRFRTTFQVAQGIIFFLAFKNRKTNGKDYSSEGNTNSNIYKHREHKIGKNKNELNLSASDQHAIVLNSTVTKNPTLSKQDIFRFKIMHG